MYFLMSAIHSFGGWTINFNEHAVSHRNGFSMVYVGDPKTVDNIEQLIIPPGTTALQQATYIRLAIDALQCLARGNVPVNADLVSTCD